MKREAQVIEQTLNSHRVPVRVLPPPHSYTTSRNYVLQLQVANGQRVDAVTRYESDLDQALTLATGRDTQVRFQLRPLSIVIPRPDPKTVQIADVLKGIKKQPGLVMTLGEAHVGIGAARKATPLRIDLANATTPHALVAGRSQSGKSTLVKGMILTLALASDPNRVRVILVDPKGRDYPQLGGLPHLAMPVLYKDGIEPMLSSVVAEIERRTATLQEVASRDPGAIYATAQNFVNIVIVIDEILSLWQSGDEPEARLLGRIASIGAGVGVHLILGTQRPTKALIGGDTLVNIPLRCCGAVSAMEEGKYATGIAGSELGAHKLTGRGDFLAVLDGRITSFQSPFINVSEQEDIRIVSGIRKWWGEVKNPWMLPMAEPSRPAAKPNESGPSMSRATIDARKDEVRDRVAEFIALNGAMPSYTAVMNIFKPEGGKQINFNTAKRIVDEMREEVLQ